MSSYAASLVVELSSLFEQPNTANDAKTQAKALRLSKQVTTAMQKPQDAALELAFWVI